MIILLYLLIFFFLIDSFYSFPLTSLLNVWLFTLMILLPSKFDLFLLTSYFKLTCAIISDYHNFRNNQYWIPSLECYFQLTDFLNAISNCNILQITHFLYFISLLCFIEFMEIKNPKLCFINYFLWTLTRLQSSHPDISKGGNIIWLFCFIYYQRIFGS